MSLRILSLLYYDSIKVSKRSLNYPLFLSHFITSFSPHVRVTLGRGCRACIPSSRYPIHFLQPELISRYSDPPTIHGNSIYILHKLYLDTDLYQGLNCHIIWSDINNVIPLLTSWDNGMTYVLWRQDGFIIWYHAMLQRFCTIWHGNKTVYIP